MKISNKARPEQVIRRRRHLVGISAAAVLSPLWSKPLINAVVLPAHAQTSMCVTDITVGGPLAGNASGATSCQAACDAEASSRGALLCDVRETDTGNGIDCACDLDLS
ncbi:hypothetical protein [Arenicella xantha]|uniref:Uncharacterized protein n=1 Tax=Arenicella xantha TaxID=644221 RepID=A0A395JI21_9GAMM|nr:hypothetical protein [Arenicella xantha]RBP48544.1 hypothetical protein DFR28_10630 [Arenicella xantha]